VEWELETARARDGLAVMTFQKVPLGSVDPRQQAVLDRLTSFRGVWRQPFRSPDDLVRLVKESLSKWLVEFWAQVKAARARHRGRLRRWLQALAVLGVAGLLGLALGPWRDLFTQRSLIAAAICVAFVIVLGIVVESGDES
jgi:hypothetical protein